MKLAELQHIFWRSVRYDPAPAEVEEVFVDQGKMDARARMAVYRNMYWYRQVDALGGCFPRLRASMGLESFTKLACDYIRQYPSENGTLERFGRKLTTLLRERNERRLFIELSDIEWSRMLALISPQPASIASFAGINPATFAVSTLRFVASLHTVESSRQSAFLWKKANEVEDEDLTAANNENTNAAGDQRSDEVDGAIRDNTRNAAQAEGGESSPAQAAKVDTASQTLNVAQHEVATHDGSFNDVRIAVWRKQHAVYHRALEDDEQRALSAAQQGATLAEICALFMEGAEDQQVATNRALGVLRRWISEQWVEAITPQENLS